MSPNKGETVVYCFHCPGRIAVGMSEAVGWCMCAPCFKLVLSWYVYDRACLSYSSFSVSQRSVHFIGTVHLTSPTTLFTEQKHYIINAKDATEIRLKTLFHN